MKIKKFLIFTIFFLLAILATSKSYSIEPDIFVQSTVNRASQALDDQFSKEEKIIKLKNIAKETVDINGIGSYTLGSYREKISSDQKEEYYKLFEEYFLKSFASRLAEYSNPEIEVRSKKKLMKTIQWFLVLWLQPTRDQRLKLIGGYILKTQITH